MNNKMSQFALALLLIVSVFSCQKEVPPSAIDPIKFVFDGTIGGDLVNYEAGINNYYLNTDFSDDGSNEVLLMKGEFLNKSNPSDSLLRFEFYGFDSTNNANLLTNVFSQTNFPSYSYDSSMQLIGDNVLRFYGLYTNTGTVNWNFGDGTTAMGDTVTHAFSSSLDSVIVRMAAFYPLANCGDSVANTVNLLDPVNGQVQFDVDAVTTDSFSFNVNAGNFNNFFWDFGNAQFGNGQVGNILYTDSIRKTVQLLATGGTNTSSWKAVVTPQFSTPCFAAYLYDVVSQPVLANVTRPPYKTCIITYKKNGVEYKSYKNSPSDQSGRNVFTLANAQMYDLNPNGQRTISINGSVNTFLYNVNNPNDSIAIKSSRLSIAVAHP